MSEWTEKGAGQTSQTLEVAVKAALLRSISHLVVATNTGATAMMLMDHLATEDREGRIQVVAVTHSSGFAVPGENEMTAEMRANLTSRGCLLVTAAHALSGAERSLSRKFNGIYPLEMIAQTLRLFGQGTKVALEISLMAMDNGALPYQKPVIAIGGTGHGADTAVLLTPGYSANFLDSRIHVILCKPLLMDHPTM